MLKTERINKIKEAQTKASEIRLLLHDIVWESQEGQEEHFYKLNKAEKIALIGVFNDAVALGNSISSYLQWFTK